MREVAGARVPGDRARGRDSGHGRRRRCGVQADVPGPFVHARRRQVRLDPAAEPGTATATRRGRHRRPVEADRRLRKSGKGARPGRTMNVAQAVGTTLAELGVRYAFGVVGSGNFHVTNALVAGGVRFVAARHEGGAATMADAYARMSDTVSVLSVHQGCGLTNAMTGVAEAAKSRTPMVVLAADVTERRSNFFVDQDALATSVGAVPMRIGAAEDAAATAARAYYRALDERCPVVLNLPLPVQAQDVPDDRRHLPPRPVRSARQPDSEQLAGLVAALSRSRRPVFIAGRGSRAPGCREALETLADRCGALLATSAVAKGLFHGNPWSLDVSGGFASPLAAELIHGADLIVGWGCALNMWTTRHGKLIGPDAVLAQVDVDASALGAHRPVGIGVLGD